MRGVKGIVGENPSKNPGHFHRITSTNTINITRRSLLIYSIWTFFAQGNFYFSKLHEEFAAAKDSTGVRAAPVTFLSIADLLSDSPTGAAGFWRGFARDARGL
jgi:hypothetical protein